MKRPGGSLIASFTVLMVLLSACAPAATPVPPPPATPSPIPATSTPEPTATATSIPSPTALPGSQVLPLDTLAKSIPWLPYDKSAAPGVNFVGFNTSKPPFNNAQVRQAFSYAVDREAIVEMAGKYRVVDPAPATTLTPPQTLGRDLYGAVGANFDPQKAKQAFTEAGYSDPTSFPKVLFLVNASGDTAPGARYNMAKAMAGMWQEHLGVTVEVQAIGSFPAYTDRLKKDTPDLYWFGWAADFNDPANFVGELFNPNGQYHGEYNYGRFGDSRFMDLIRRANGNSSDPQQRQELYIQAERLLCETDAAIIPLYFTVYKG